jgi:hypothetical protein
MTPLPTVNWRAYSWWTRFWHAPVRAEPLACFRILLGAAMLADQLLQLLPRLDEFFCATGVAPTGLHDWYAVKNFRWTIWLFNHDQPSVVYSWFAIWVAVTLTWTIGFFTRLSNVAVWFMTMCFVNRNPNILNGGDDTMQVGIFLVLLSPCGRALSVDAWLARRRGKLAPGPAYVYPWSLRLMQIQLCVIYASTGLVKVKGECDCPDPWWDVTTIKFAGTWWDGTSIHNVLNYVTMSRWSFAQLPLPFWLTRLMTYTCVWWEVLFTPLVLHRWTRKWTLWFGVAFHLGIWFTIEVGWFSFYTLAYYGAWIPGEFWDRRPDRKQREQETKAAGSPAHTKLKALTSRA